MRYRTHGRSKSPMYIAWTSMKRRCLSPSDHSFSRYGGRGIKVCERWLKFENFLADMGERPGGMSLDRINNDGNYEPGNCRWATPHEQARNKRQAAFLIVNGECRRVRDIEIELGLSQGALWHRLKSGMTPEAAATTPRRTA